MGKLFLILISILINSNNLFSQIPVKDFEIALTKQKVKHSLYKTIQFVDSRYDTTNMGMVQIGAFDRRAMVVATIPISTQLTAVINSLTDATAKDGELLLQLRKLHFVEITGVTSQNGSVFLRAILYSKKGDSYQKITSIDTVVTVDFRELTKVLLKDAGKLITNLIADNLLQQASPDLYSLNDIISIDSIEKRKIKLYNTAEYADGLYSSYKSFMDQVPDKQLIVEMENGKITSLKALKDNGKEIKVKEKDIYSIVYKGQPYIETDYGFYPLQKRNDDFYFIGKAKITANGGDVMAASALLGIAGAIVASSSEGTFEMKIDHINGRPVHIRRIKDDTPPADQ
jgi:hypothetical protein